MSKSVQSFRLMKRFRPVRGGLVRATPPVEVIDFTGTVDGAIALAKRELDRRHVEGVVCLILMDGVNGEFQFPVFMATNPEDHKSKAELAIFK